VLATDILPMDPVRTSSFLQGDFTEEAVLNQFSSAWAAISPS